MAAAKGLFGGGREADGDRDDAVRQPSLGGVERWREKRLSARTRRVIPQKVRDWFSDAGHTAKERFESLPGAAEFTALFDRALGGLVDLGSRAAMATVREARFSRRIASVATTSRSSKTSRRWSFATSTR